MNDLLGDIKGKGNALYSNKDDDDFDIEQGRSTKGGGAGASEPAAPPTEQELSMGAFFKSVEAVKGDLAQIKALQLEVTELHERGKTIVKTKEVQRHQEAMQDKINQVNTLAHKLKKKVEVLDSENELASKVKGQGIGSATERTRTTITAGLKKKLKDLMGEFSDLRNRIQEEYREVVERRLRTITGEKVSEEDVDKVIETGEAENLFQKALMEQGRGRVLDVLAEIQERNRAVKDLEQSMLELHQIFLDMAVLVEAQGEMLDNIQKQVERSVNYVKTGTDALVDAKRLQKNTRKWMCCGIIILLIVALIIVLAVVQPWKLAKT